MTDKKTYEELVDPDETGEAAGTGEQPYVGQLGPDNAGDAEEAGYWEGMKEKGSGNETAEPGLVSKPE